MQNVFSSPFCPSVRLSIDLVRAVFLQPLTAGSSNFAGVFLRGSSCATSWSDLCETFDLDSVTFGLKILSGLYTWSDLCVTFDLDPVTLDLHIHFGLDTMEIFSGAEGY